MTRNQKLLLLSILCIFVTGLSVSYKSYKIHQETITQNQNQIHQEKLKWISSLMDQKLSQIESSVTYLDQSTIETLKRNGARYFAYAYKQNNEWSLKWKVIGTTKKDQILSEIEPIKFDEITSTVRHWMWSKNGELIYISPVDLADSHQLKNGFLIFGLTQDFFSQLQDKGDEILVFAKDRSIIDGKDAEIKNTVRLEIKKRLSDKATSLNETIQAQTSMISPFFSTTSQLWFVFVEPLVSNSFITSSFFLYSLLALTLCLLLFFVLTQGLKSADVELEDQEENFAPTKTLNFSQNLRSFFRSKKRPLQDPSVQINSPQLEVIGDFEEFLDDILSEEYPRLTKLDIQIKTTIEEGASLACSRQHLSDFIKRLIGNSVLSLEEEKKKEIQIQLVEQKDSYQLIYLDTRHSYMPSGHESSLFLQTEGSLVGIDGIISYGSWLFGQNMTVAKHGFCLSIDLAKKEVWLKSQKEASQSNELGIKRQPGVLFTRSPLESAPLMVKPIDLSFNDSLEMSFKDLKSSRFEINEDGVDEEMLDQFRALNSELEPQKEDQDVNTESLMTTSRLEDVLSEFKLKNLNFKNEIKEPKAFTESENFKKVSTNDQISLNKNSVMGQTQNQKTTEAKKNSPYEISKGLFQFNSGNFKIKVRSPKKRDMDVNNQDI